MDTYQLIVGNRVHPVTLNQQELQALISTSSCTAVSIGHDQGSDDNNPPSPGQIKFARAISTALDVPLPPNALTSSYVCWHFINDNKAKFEAAQAQKWKK